MTTVGRYPQLTPRRPLRLTLVSVRLLRASVGCRPDPDEAHEMDLTNLGIACLKAYLDAQPDIAERAQVANLYFPLFLGDERFEPSPASAILATNPDVVGLSCYVWNQDAILALAGELKETNPALLIVLGGHLPTVAASAVLRKHAAVDLVVRGEGEVPLAQLIRNGFARPEEVAGVTYRDAEGRPQERPPFFVDDLSVLPSPYVAGLAPAADANVSMEVNRGCPYRCAYCAPAIRTRRYRYFPFSRIESEMKWAREHSVVDVFLFTSNSDPRTPLFKKMVSRMNEIYRGADYILRFDLDPSAHVPEIVDHLRDVSLDKVRFGVQSISSAVLKRNLRKPEDLSLLERTIKATARLAPALVEIMLALPGDNFDGFRRTVEWFLRLNDKEPGTIGDITVCWTMAMPGTPMHENPRRFGIERFYSESLPYIVETDTFTRRDMERALNYLADLKDRTPISWFDLDPRHAFPDTGPVWQVFSGMDQGERRLRRRERSMPHALRAGRGELRVTLVASVIISKASQSPARTGATYPAWAEQSHSIALLKAWCDSVADFPRKVTVTNRHLPLCLGDDRFTEEQVDEILATDPEVVGLSCYIWDLSAMADLAAALKRRRPALRIVMGGLAATPRASEILARHPAVEVVIRGEGEIPLERLLRTGWDALDTVPGLTFRRGDEILENGPPFMLPDLTRLPSAYVAGLIETYGGHASIEISRGCPYSCAFCATADTRRLRCFSVDRIRADVEWLRDHGVATVFFNETNTNPLTRRFREITRLIDEVYGEREHRVGIQLDLSARGLEVVDGLAGVSLDRIVLGVQTLNPRALERVGRVAPDRARLREAIRGASRLSRVQIDLILGLPGDDLRGFVESVEWCAAIEELTAARGDEIVVFWAIAVPGTAMGDRPADFGIRELRPAGIPYVLDTDTFPHGDLVRAMAHVARRRRSAPIYWSSVDPGRFLPEVRQAGIALVGEMPVAMEDAARVPDRAEPAAAAAVAAPRCSNLAETIASLLAPEIRPGARAHSGWSLREIGNSESGVSLLFSAGAGRTITLVVTPRDDTRPAFGRTRRFNFFYQKGEGDIDVSFVRRVGEILAARDI